MKDPELANNSENSLGFHYSDCQQLEIITKRIHTFKIIENQKYRVEF